MRGVGIGGYLRAAGVATLDVDTVGGYRIPASAIYAQELYGLSEAGLADRTVWIPPRWQQDDVATIQVPQRPLPGELLEMVMSGGHPIVDAVSAYIDLPQSIAAHLGGMAREVKGFFGAAAEVYAQGARDDPRLYLHAARAAALHGDMTHCDRLLDTAIDHDAPNALRMASAYYFARGLARPAEAFGHGADARERLLLAQSVQTHDVPMAPVFERELGGEQSIANEL
jgi:hypothetical protein